MRVRWSAEARADFLGYIRQLATEDIARGRRARTEIEAVVAQLARFPELGRPSRRWSGLREKSLTDWRKLVAYEADDRQVVILLFLDARQDLDAVRINPE